MSDVPSATPAILTIFSSSSTKQVVLSNFVPAQIIYLIGYRVEFTDSTVALANPVLYIDAPFLSPNQLIDAIPGRTYFPIMMDNSKVTNYQGLNKAVYLSEDIPRHFEMVFRNGTDFEPVSGLVNICLQFRTSHSSFG